MRRIIATVASVALLLTGLVQAAAQRFEGMNATSRGRGVVRVGNLRDQNLRRATVNLRRNGVADIELEGESQTPTTLEGRWVVGQSRNTVDLEIERGFGAANTTGRGTVTLRIGGFDRLEISGMRDGERYTVTFDVTPEPGGGGGGGGGSGAGSVTELNGTSRGRGMLRMRGNRDQMIEQVTLELRRTGEFEMRIDGQLRATTFRGRWFEATGNSVEIEIRSSSLSNDTYGTGRLTVRRNTLERIELNGTSTREEFTVNFDAEGRPGGPPTSPTSPFIGTFSTRVPTRNPRENYEIVRRLRLQSDGSARLISRYEGSVPSINRDSLRIHGELLRDIAERGRVFHNGTWKTTGNRLELRLTGVGEDREDRKVLSVMTFNLRGTDLLTITFDRINYGTGGLRFSKNAGDDDTDDSQPPSDQYAGTYLVRLQIPDTVGEIGRTLEILPRGVARLTTEYVGANRPRFGFRATRELGSLLRRLETRQTVVHTGSWSVQGSQLVVRLTDLESERLDSTIRFNVRGDELESVSFDNDLYGTRQFRFTRRNR